MNEVSIRSISSDFLHTIQTKVDLNNVIISNVTYLTHFIKIEESLNAVFENLVNFEFGTKISPENHLAYFSKSNVTIVNSSFYSQKSIS